MEEGEEEKEMRPLLLSAFWGLCSITAPAQRLALTLPTANKGLAKGDLAAFYMPTDLKTKPPESGSWGFVRNLRSFPERNVYTRFHEGLDIRPVARNARGIPTDPVKAIASGVVAYANASASASNYGKYVVVQHNFGYGPMYSLYAHLGSVTVRAGQRVVQGAQLGVLGSTGRGLNNARAHLHIELDIMLSERYDDYIGGGNPHGNCNGLNLAGIDLADIYKTMWKNPKMNLAKYIHALPQHYRITIPQDKPGPLPIVQRYPWMKFGNHDKPAKSWEMAFTRAGFLIGVAPSDREVSKPTVTFVRSTSVNHSHFTIGRLTGTGSSAKLTSSGERYIRLLTDDFPHRN